MSGKTSGNSGTGQIYQIRVEEKLNTHWKDWFEVLAVELEDDCHTVITCQVVDQAGLHGIIKKVRDLGLTLVSVNRVVPDQIEDVVNK